MFRMTVALSCLATGLACFTLARPVRAQDQLAQLPSFETLTPKIDALFATWDKPDSPGCLLGILHQDRLIYEKGYGMAYLDYDIPISPKSVFPIASLSKQFTAACIALLADEGKISLNDDIRKYLPEMPDYDHPIELQHLLHHTSGIRDHDNELLNLPGMWGGSLSEDELLKLLARQRNLHFQPGEAFRYSNSGYFLLGIIVKRVSGLSLREFAKRRLFEPLGMTNTHFHDDPTQTVKHRVVGYFSNRQGEYQLRNPSNGTGDGGVFTTLGDLVLWQQAASTDRLGKPGFFDRLTVSGRLNNGDAARYAFGLNLGEYRGQKTVWHTGAFPGFRTITLRFPALRFTIIILANLGGPRGLNAYQLAHRVADVCLSESLAPPQPQTKPATDPTFVQLSAADLEGKTGAFLDRDGAPWVISAKAGTLQVTIGVFDPQTTPTGALSPRRFKSIGDSPRFELEFADSGDAGPAAVRVHQYSDRPFLLNRVELVRPSPKALQEYVGEYYSEELDTTYRLVLKDDQLLLSCKHSPNNPLAATIRDTFKARWRGGNLQLKFLRDSSNTVAEFDFSQGGGVRDIQFVRRTH